MNKLPPAPSQHKSIISGGGSFSRFVEQPSIFAEITAQAKRDKLWVLPACLDPEAKHPWVEWKHLQTQKPTSEDHEFWLHRYADRNGCYLTGPVLGRFVLDCDDAKAIRWARRKGLPPTQQVITSRGRHFHFAYPKNLHVGSSVKRIHAGIDIRGAKGIAVAVGSVHKSGFKYRWARGCSPQEVKLAQAPEWLFDWLRKRAVQATSTIIPVRRPFTGSVGPYAAAIIERELEQLRLAVERTRNGLLARVAFKFGQLVAGKEACEDEVIAAIYAIAKIWTNPAKSRDTIRRAFDAGLLHPRSAPPQSVIVNCDSNAATTARLRLLANGRFNGQEKR